MMTFGIITLPDSSDEIDEPPERSDKYSYSRKTQREAHSGLYVSVWQKYNPQPPEQMEKMN